MMHNHLQQIDGKAATVAQTIPGSSADVMLLHHAAQSSATRRAGNRAAVLQSLYRRPQSRADLARELVLPRVRVSELTAELLEQGLIEESGLQRRQGAGKPAQLLRVRDEAFTIWALDLSDESHFVAAISDLRGRILYRAETTVGNRQGAEALELVVDLVHRLQEASEDAPIGLGIATSGVVVGDRITRVASRLGWGPTELMDRIRGVVDCEVQVINDANAAALGAYSLQANPSASLLVVTIEHGVAAGLIVAGGLVTGTAGSAGEIGHVVVDDAGEPCPCGLRGCLDMAASALNIRRRADASGLPRARLVEDGARTLGRALAPMLAVTGVSDVLVTGPGDTIDESFVATLSQTLTTRVFADLAEKITVRTAANTEQLVLAGAAASVRAVRMAAS